MKTRNPAQGGAHGIAGLGKAANSDADYTAIEAALSYIPANDRDTWLRMGMAVKSALGEAGFSLWNEWSQTTENYTARATRDVWRSIKLNGGVTIGSLFHEAKQHGYRREEGISESVYSNHVVKAKSVADDMAILHAKARARAAYIWQKSLPVDTHPYLASKRVKAFGIRQHQGCLVIPLRDTLGVIHSLQFIDAEGNKRFLTGDAISGHYHAVGKYQGTLCIAEGYATSTTVYQTTRHAVAVAFNAGNLKPVAVALRTKFPDARIVVCADNDPVGIAKGREAAQAVQGCIALPDFEEVGHG